MFCWDAASDEVLRKALGKSGTSTANNFSRRCLAVLRNTLFGVLHLCAYSRLGRLQIFSTGTKVMPGHHTKEREKEILDIAEALPVPPRLCPFVSN